MKTTRIFVLVAALYMVLAGCSKSDGSKPKPNSVPSPKTGTATIYAGNGKGGTADGQGVASFAGAFGIVMDKNGNLFVSDYLTTLIRKVTPDGTVSTFAGSTTLASTGHAASNDGAGTLASFTAPAGMAIDGAGNIYVADKLVIRKITPAGAVTTLAGSNYYNNSNFLELTLDASGNVYASDINNEVILKISPAGSSVIYAKGGDLTTSGFKEPLGIAFDSSGNLFLVDGDDAIHQISPDKTIITIAGMIQKPGFNNGTGAAASFYNPLGLVRDSAGSLFVSDYGNRAIREILPNGSVSTVLLTNDNNTANGPSDIVFDPAGNLYIAEGASVLKVTLK